MIFDPYELNYSKIKTYINCPMLYKYMYVERKRPPLTAPASLGISIHRTLESYHRNGQEFDDLMNAYDSNWLGVGYKTAQEQMEYYLKGKNMLKRYWEYEKDRKTSIDYIECDFEFPYGKWRIKGTIDRIDRYPDDKWEIIDYKTGTEIQTEKEIISDLQLGIYSIGAKRTLNINPSFISFWFLAYAKKVSSEYNSSKEDFILEKFISTGEKILKGDFKPNHSHCCICGFKDKCPSVRNFG